MRNTRGVKLPPGSERVARSLLHDGPGTAAQLAGRLSVSPTAARRHLDLLVESDFAYASQTPPYGPRPLRGRGRPARVFAITERGRGALEQAYEDLASSAMDYLDGSGAVADFARFHAERLESRLAHVRDLPEAQRPSALAEALTTEGFAASLVGSDGADGAQICQHHCPVAGVASRFPTLCEAETAMFGRILGTHVLRLATIAHGDGVCTTHVPAASPAFDRMGRTSA